MALTMCKFLEAGDNYLLNDTPHMIDIIENR